jgi:DNA polymerase-3 subunit beta
VYFEIPRKDLLNPLKIVVSVVEQRQALPILANILVSVKDNALHLTGTDAEVEISCTVPLEPTIGLENDGETTLPARKLFDIIRSLPEKEPIKISITDNKAILKSGKSRFTLSCLPAEDFPTSPTVESMLTFKLSQQAFKNLLAHTSYAMAVSDPRYYLNGLCLDIQAEQLTVVATDGHRLALATTTLNHQADSPPLTPENEPLQVILPRKAVLELQRILEGTEDEIEIAIGDSAVKVIISEQYTLSSQLIDGKFPDYAGVVPHNPEYIVLVETNTIKTALTQVIILSHEKHRGTRLAFSEGKMVVSSRNPEQEEATVECEVDYSGEEFEIGFNVNYLQDALTVINTKSAHLKFSSPESSVLITPADSEETKMVVMPMRI